MQKKVILGFAISLMQLMIFSLAKADETIINSNLSIAANTTWQDTVIIDGATVTVEQNATLTIKPGTVIAGKNGALIMVAGKLIALGDKNKKIRFTEEENLNKNFSLTYSIYTVSNSEIELENFILEKGGGNKGNSATSALTIKGKARLTAGIIRRNRTSAVRIWNPDLSIKNCEIYENESIALENKTTGQLKVEGNWWGTDNGPKNTSAPDGNWLYGNFDSDPWQKKGPIPIVIVPGFGGSFSLQLLNGKAKDRWWLPQVGVSAYRHIAKALVLSNYFHEKDFYWGFYDWRLPCEESAIKYLEPVIQKAQAESGHFQVHVLTHSMGGLVARSYIEGDGYRDEVDRLVMAGTPNLGSSEIYPIWEGGELSGGKKPIVLYLWYLMALDQDWNRVEYIQGNFPSLGEMRPIYDYLLNANSRMGISYGDLKGKNKFLETLDAKRDLLKRKVMLSLIAGTGEETLEKIPVLPYAENDGKWRDGVPKPLPQEEDITRGDGTVTVKSATRDGKLTEEIATIESEHGKIFQKADKTILNALRVQAKFPLLYKVMHHFLLSARGPVDIEISDSQGRILSAARQEIADSRYEELENGEKSLAYADFPIEIEEQAEERLKVTFIGRGKGTFKAALWHLTEDDELSNLEEENSIEPGVKISYTIVLSNATSSEPQISLEKTAWSDLLTISYPKIDEVYLDWQYLIPEANICQNGEDVTDLKFEYKINSELAGNKIDLGLLKLARHSLKAKGQWKINGQEQTEEKERTFYVSTSPKSMITLINRFYEEQKIKDWQARSALINLIAEAYQESSNGRKTNAKNKIAQARRILESKDQSFFVDMAIKNKLIGNLLFLESEPRFGKL